MDSLGDTMTLKRFSWESQLSKERREVKRTKRRFLNKDLPPLNSSYWICLMKRSLTESKIYLKIKLLILT